MKEMQSSTATSFVQDGGPTYQFQRQASEPTDTLLHGVGHPAAETGMVKSAFRPSDDATTLPFLVPANAMAVVELRRTTNIVQALIGGGDSISSEFGESYLNGLANDITSIAYTINAGIQKYGIGVHPLTGNEQYAYEVDGYGNMYYADDANVPSLLSLPYLGYVNATDPIYINTRNFVLSSNNPWYFSGKAGAGVGGPHVGLNSIWPMSIIIQALTSTDSEEITNCVELLVDSTANTGLMHESFNKDDVCSYTRPWFAWANSLFGELVLKLYDEGLERISRS
jgi:meiotically up-regulated gene 157 (Mug157) protein